MVNSKLQESIQHMMTDLKIDSSEVISSLRIAMSIKSIKEIYKDELQILHTNVSVDKILKAYGNLKKNRNNYIFLTDAANLYVAAGLIADDDIKRKYSKIIRKPFNLIKWFPDIREVISEIKKINDEGKLLINYDEILLVYYTYYIKFKGLEERMSYTLRKYNGRNQNALQIALFKYFQNKKKKPFKKVIQKDFLFEESMKQFLEFFNDILPYLDIQESVKEYFNKIASGRVEKLFLKPLFDKIQNI